MHNSPLVFKTNRMISDLFHRLCFSVFPFLYVFSIISFSEAAPMSLTYQGRILKVDGTPLEYGNVSFIFQITDPSGQCMIYQEQINSINMANSDGVFDVPIGTATIQFPLGGTATVLDVFNNSSSYTCGSCSSANGVYTCANGSNTYTATANDIRKLRVSFYDGSAWRLITPDNTIRSVPFAAYSLSAQKLGTNSASDFLLKAGLPTCGAGTFLTWSGSALTCGSVSGTSGGTVTTVTSSNSYLSVATGTSTPALTVNVGTIAGTLAAGDDSRITGAFQSSTSLGGDLTGTLPTPAVSKINGVSVSSAVVGDDGKFLKFVNGSGWQPYFVKLSELKNATGAASAFNVGTCTSAQTLVWSSITDQFSCQDISLSASKVTGLATVATSGAYSDLTGTPTLNSLLPTQTGQNGKYLTTDGTNTSWAASSSQWTTSGSNIYYNSGNVGIGTTAPTTPLEVNGNIKSQGASIEVTKTDTSGSLVGAKVYLNHEPPSISTAQVMGIDLNITAYDNGDGSISGASYTGINSTIDSILGGGVTSLTAVNGDAKSGGGGSPAASLYGVKGSVTGQNLLANKITNGYAGYFSTSATGASTITNGYGVYVGTIGGAANKYSIYASDASAKSYFAGNVGIGTTAPSFPLSLGNGTAANDGAIIAQGAQGSGSSLTVSGAGTRMIWYPKKAAFRAGGATSTKWDDTNIGNYSVAFGWGNQANGDYSFASGASNTVSGAASAVFGQSNTVSADSSLSIGSSNNVTGGESAAIGSFLYGNYNAALVIGRYNANAGDGTNKPVFIIGNGTSPAARRNVMVALDNGNVGIGTASPGSTLDVKGTFLQSLVTTEDYKSGITTVVDSSGPTNFVSGITNYVTTSGNNSGTVLSDLGVYGIKSSVEQPLNAGANINSIYGVYSYVKGRTGNTIGNVYSLYAEALGNATNAYGVYIANLGGANTWGLYQADSTDKNYFAGNVGIGNTSPAKLLHVGSASVATGTAVANFQNVDGTCTITPAASGSGIACSSDERLKENFEDVLGDYALSNILKLQAVTYNFKTSSPENRRTGYKAQEVQKIAPEFVRENDDGYLQVYYDAFIPWITESIKTLYGRIASVVSHQETQDRQIASVQAQAAQKADKTEIEAFKTENAAKVQKLEAENAALKVRAEKSEKENAEIKARLERIEKALQSK